MDFSEILDGLSTGSAITSMIAAAALIAIVGFAMWAAKSVASFFDDDDGSPGGDYDYDYEHACAKCESFDPDPENGRICESCAR